MDISNGNEGQLLTLISIDLYLQLKIKYKYYFFVLDFYGKITELKLKGVKVILGVGGIENSIDGKWSRMAAKSEQRRIFVRSVLKFIKKWKFDGVQIAWQYPTCKEVNESYIIIKNITLL